MEQAEKTMIENLHKNTGKTLEQWIGIVKESGLTKHGEVIKFLKESHGFTHGFANLVAHKAKGSDAGSADNPDNLIAKQYQGKENLRPIYDHLIGNIRALGADVEIAPKNAYVSLRRKKQFALLQPSTKTRLDLGLNIKDQSPEGKLEASGSFNAMCTHRVRLEHMEDADAQVMVWLKKAYDQAG
ncbi:MAG: DUF4287 domain-containing protein [Lewinellaceae bacterium]|nr:DUF4287 domain-containing protein [Saprospiraceae bacterium]MCB9353417.1 DUF4287 domain-containing protein [Lewinellaceae bacterium]